MLRVQRRLETGTAKAHYKVTIGYPRFCRRPGGESGGATDYFQARRRLVPHWGRWLLVVQCLAMIWSTGWPWLSPLSRQAPQVGMQFDGSEVFKLSIGHNLMTVSIFI